MSDKKTTCWIISAVTETCHYGKLMRYYVLDENGSVVCETKTHKEAQKIVEAVNFKELYDDRAKYPKDVSEEILRMKERIEKLEKTVNTETDPRWSGAGSLKGYPVSSLPEQETYSRWVGMGGGATGFVPAPEFMKTEQSFVYKKGDCILYVEDGKVYEGIVEKDVPYFSIAASVRPIVGSFPLEIATHSIFKTYTEAYKYANS